MQDNKDSPERTSKEDSNSKPRPQLPVFAGRGGLQPGVKDALTHRALLDALDEPITTQRPKTQI